MYQRGRRFAMDNVRVERLIVVAGIGARVDLCIRDAVALAMNEGRDVTLMFNNKEYKIEVEKIIDYVNLASKGGGDG
jgi:hypothetical protein